MILDKSVVDLLNVTDEQLELTLERVRLDTGVQLITNDLQVLQDQLQRIKIIVDKTHVSLRQGSTRTERIDFTVLLDIATHLPHITAASSAASAAECTDSSDLIVTLRNCITKYILVLCYYGIVAETLVQLPRAMDTEAYFETVNSSLLNKLIYSLQTSINDASSLFRLFFKKTKQVNLKDLPQLTQRFYNNELQPTVNKILMVKNFQLIGLPTFSNKKNRIMCLLSLPNFFIENKIQSKLANVTNYNNQFTIGLGKLIQEFPTETNLKTQFESITVFLENSQVTQDTNINNLYDLIYQTHNFVNKPNQIQRVTKAKPSIIVRYWPLALVVVLNGPELAQSAWESRLKILDFFNENVIQFTKGLIINWIWTPIKDIWATVRHDEGSEIAMMSNGTLDSEMDSLCRMVVNVIKDNDPSFFQIMNEATLADEIKHGNLNEFMRIYENELNSPIKNIFTGKLIRSILIQVQKTKVDGSLALNGIDQMLKSQQLVFGILALSPATIVIYMALNSITKLIKLGNVWSNLQSYKDKLSNSLNNIERILNYSDFEIDNVDLKNANHALLILEISNLYYNGTVVIPKQKRNDWNRDIEELININFTKKAKLNVVNRIYHVYFKYFLL